MDVDFMVSDSMEVSFVQIGVVHVLTGLQAVRPKLIMAKTLEEAAAAVDDMFSSAYQDASMLFSIHLSVIERQKCQMMKAVMIAMKKALGEKGLMKRKNRMLLFRKVYGAFLSSPPKKTC